MTEDGYVDLWVGTSVPHSPDFLATIRSIEIEIKDILADATRIDEEAARALWDTRMTQLDITGDGHIDQSDIERHQKEGQTLDLSSQATLREILAGMPLNGSKREQQQWWNSLSVREQQMYMNAVPLEVAGMKGLPDEVRRQLSGPAELGYDKLKLLQYAQDHWNDKDIDTMENNCTNFVSRGLEYAGLKRKGGVAILDILDRDSWTHDLWSTIWPNGPWEYVPGVYSHAWGGANAQHDLFVRHGSQELAQRDVRPGDIVYWSYKNGEEHHAAVVTGVLPNGDVLYTQHTHNREDQSLGARLPYNHVKEGDQDIRFVRVKQIW